MHIFVAFYVFFTMFFIIFLPIAMMKFGMKMTGRDLFFMFVGMFVLSGFTLIAVLY